MYSFYPLLQGKDVFNGKFIVQFVSPVQFVSYVPFINYVQFVSVKFVVTSVAFTVTFSVLLIFMVFVGGDSELLPIVEVFAILIKVTLSKHGPT